MASGRWDADLGGGVFKQRIAREGGGKSGGFRTIVLFVVGGHSFFVHGFTKSEKANVTAKELKALKALARVFLSFDAEALEKVRLDGVISEVVSNGEGGEQE